MPIFAAKHYDMNKQSTNSVLIAILLILAAAISRVIQYPFNFSPMFGIAVFSGAIIKDKRLAIALPLFSMFLSDLMFEIFKIAPGFWGWGQLVGYGLFAIITIIAFSLKRINVLTVAGYSILSAVIFFLLSNASFFVFDNPVYHTYPQNIYGLYDCYVAGLPFFRTSLISSLIYSGLLFGGYYLFTQKVSGSAMAKS